MIYWLTAGVVLFFAEAAFSGFGLLFAGLGALTVGMLLDFSFISEADYLLQVVIFFASTALWAVILWKPLQKFKIGKKQGNYNNIIGQTATVGQKGLSKKDGGEVTWSGAIMKAKLHEHSDAENLKAGTQVVVKEITGNILVVTAK